MRARWRRLIRVDCEGVEGCEEFSAHAIETFIAKIESSIAVECKRNVWIRGNAGGANNSCNTALWIDGVDVVAEVGGEQFSANGSKIKNVESQSSLANDRFLAG